MLIQQVEIFTKYYKTMVTKEIHISLWVWNDKEERTSYILEGHVMKKYAAIKNNHRIIFNNKENAENYISEHSEYNYEEYNEWRYYDPHYRNSTTSYRDLRGESLIATIEHNFSELMRTVGLYGASGYTLKQVYIRQRGNIATLTIIGWCFSSALVGYEKSMLNDDNLKTINIDILDVEDGDVPNGFYEFEILK